MQQAMDRILIVDDNQGMRELLSQLLLEWSYATVTAGTLEEARNIILSQEPFKAVVCDFELPDGNGLQFLSWLRWERQNQTRFLLISGSASFVRYRPSDFAFLAKPFHLEELRSRLEELIATKGEAR
jgi:DNA-binding NtrC family response regulator